MSASANYPPSRTSCLFLVSDKESSPTQVAIPVGDLDAQPVGQQPGIQDWRLVVVDLRRVSLPLLFWVVVPPWILVPWTDSHRLKVALGKSEQKYGKRDR